VADAGQSRTEKSTGNGAEKIYFMRIRATGRLDTGVWRSGGTRGIASEIEMQFVEAEFLRLPQAHCGSEERSSLCASRHKSRK